MQENSLGKQLIEIFAWIGVTIILLAYALVSFDIIASNSIGYQLLNLIGATGIASISVIKRVFQSVVLNCIWAVIAFVAIMKILT
tara:strand:+ start:230 stop:484 length:255 start_codon:yes stop_codon:yes gene_type:complete